MAVCLAGPRTSPHPPRLASLALGPLSEDRMWRRTQDDVAYGKLYHCMWGFLSVTNTNRGGRGALG